MNARTIIQHTQRFGQWLTPRCLKDQNRRFAGTCGVSQANRVGGFVPAFTDHMTGAVYLSRFADGRQAPVHMLDGLPAELVMSRSRSGRVVAVRETVEAGFVRDGEFYTRKQAAAAAVTEH